MREDRFYSDCQPTSLTAAWHQPVIRLFLFCLIALCFPFSTSQATTTDGAKQILYINANHRGYDWSDDVERGLRDTLDASPQKVDLSVVYLDTLRFPDEETTSKVAELLALKHVANNTDLVITSDNAGLAFALDHQSSLLPSQPIVFTALRDFATQTLASRPQVTGVAEYTDFQPAIDLALSLHPATTSLAFVGTTDESHNQRVLDIVTGLIEPKYADVLNVKIITDHTVDELGKSLAQLPKDSLIFAISNTLSDADGNALTPAETARSLASLTSSPVYTFWHSHLGHGVVGGQIATGYSQGKAAGQLALEVLEQEPDSSLPPIQAAPSSLFFDLEVADKHNINLASVPTEARFINYQAPIWQEYKNEVLITLVTIFALISLVLAFILLTKRQSDTIHQIHDENTELTHALDLNQEALEDITHQFEEVNPNDGLTGLGNVRHFNTMLEKELKRASRYKTPLSLLLISIDRFEDYKETCGEDKADELLTQLGATLGKTCQRSSDVLAHLADEKFAILLPHTTQENAEIVCQKLHDNLLNQGLAFVLSPSGRVTLSIGLSSLESSQALINPQHMFNTSEMMRIQAEKQGGNTTRAEGIKTQSAENPLWGA